MSFDRERLWLQDILDNITRIEDYTAGLDFEAYLANDLVSDAVERCLSRISEAVVRIGVERMVAIAPDVPSHAVKGLGNALRHDYGRIDPAIIFTTVIERLPRLKEDCLKALR